MSALQGDFSCAELLTIQAKANEIFADDVRNPDYVAYADAAIAILENQTAKFEMLQNPDKDRDLTIHWITDCADDVFDISSECDNGGAEAQADCKNYIISNGKEVRFTVGTNQFRTSLLSEEEVMAQMFLRKQKLLDEELARFMVTKLELFAGVNQLTDPYTINGTTTEIPPSAFTPDLWGYFAQAMIVNKLGNAYWLGGSQLWIQKWRAMMEAANAEGKGAAQKFTTMKMYNDLFNVDSVLGKKASFLINPNSVAFVHKVRYPRVPMMINADNVTQKRWSAPSKTLPGVFYDYTYSIKCEDDDIKHNFKIVGRFDMFQNPTGCEPDRTGILEFECVA